MAILRIITVPFIFSILLFSCGNKIKDAPAYIVDEEKLVPLLVDIHLTDAMLTKEKRPQTEKYKTAIEMYPSIFLKYDIDRALFDSTIKYYSKYPHEFNLIYDEVLRELSILEGRVQKTPGAEDEEEE